jgi:hypothetical protein
MVKRWLLLPSLLLALVACAPPSDARSVTLVADGKTRQITTEALTVRDLLEEADLTLDADDRVTPAEPTLIKDAMTVRVIRVETRVETEEREIPYDRRTVHEASIPAGETQLLEPGVSGIEELTYRITLEDGVEVDRRLVRQTTLREPRTEVVLVGAQSEQKPVTFAGTIAYIVNHNAWLMQRTSLNQRRLTYEGDLDGRVFSLSTGGTHLLFTRVPADRREISPGHPDTGEGGTLNTLWVLDTSTANASPVRLEVESVLWVAWDPGCQASQIGSGCRIAYTTGRVVEGNPGWRAENDLWVARLRPDTGDLFAKQQLLEPVQGGGYSWWGTTYTWSPDGQSLAYARADEVGVVRLQEGEQEALYRFPPYRTYAPWVWTPSVEWSPESSYIITTLHGPAPTGQAPEDSPVFDVWALSADGTITAELASEAGMWSTPTFAPETDAVAFGRARSPYASQTSSYELHLMDRDGSNHRLIFPMDEEIGLDYPEAAWSPKGDQIIVVYQENLFLIDVPSAEEGSEATPSVHQLTVAGGVTAVEWQPGRWAEDGVVEPAAGEDAVGPEDQGATPSPETDSEALPQPD